MSGRTFHPGRLLLWLSPFLILTAGAVYVGLRWEEIPAQFPIHWGRGGAPDGWATRTPLAVGMPLMIGAILNVFILGMAVIFSKKMNRLYAGEAAGAERRAHGGMETWAVVIADFIALLCALIAGAMPFAGSSRRVVGLVVLCSIMGSLALVVFFMLMMVQVNEAMEAARRIALANGTLDPAVDRARRDPKYWKWGIFYNNPDDPAVWVEKLYGAGWTTNMARRESWWWLAGFVGATGVVIALVAWAIHC